jgi:ribonuclease E
MAEPDTATLAVAPLPSSDDLERAEAFAREPFLLEGEDASVSLAPGMPRRVALEWVLKELAEGHTAPSSKWRRRWSLLLGLDRLLSQDEPTLVDGTVLSAHQVDALSGTLTALLAESQRGANGNGRGNGATVSDEPLMLASAAIPGEEDLPEELVEDEPDEEPLDWTDPEPAVDQQAAEAAEDPNAAKRFWFEHATGAGKTVAALGFVEASRTGGILILTHRRNLVDQFHGELRDRGYAKRISPALLAGKDNPHGPVTVETYQWFVRNAGKISDAYTIVICDEAHTALGEKTSAAIRNWSGPVFVGMTATGALIARHVTDLFPTQTSRFDLAQAARRGVIAPLRAVRIPPGPGVRTIAKVPLRRGEVDTEFDQEMLAELLDQMPFNLAIADLYKTRFNGVPGVVYSAGVRHAYNVAQAFRDSGMKAQAVSGETKKRELARILAAYERGDIDVLVNAQLLAEGWNSPRATVCMHLAPTASRRIYQQRVGRVTRRHPGKEAGIVVDFVHPATKHDDPVVTLHSLLDRDVYRGGAIVVGPVRRGRGRRLRVERRVVPVTSDENRRIEVFERELWRIAVEHLDYGEQVQWAALAGARVAPAGWRRARAMLHFDEGGELKRAFLLTAVERNKNPQLRLRALQEIAASRDAEAFDRAIEMIGGWPREEKSEGVKAVLQSLAEKKIGRRDQANNWIWACAEMTREIHEEYAIQRWPETKRLLGLLVNSSGGAHARNARRLVHAARQQDRRLAAALLAAALPHTAEAGEVINGARTRMSRKPAALARELLRNFPKGGKGRRGQRRRKKGKAGEGGSQVEALEVGAATFEDGQENGAVEEKPRRRRSQSGGSSRRGGRSRAVRHADPDGEAPGREVEAEPGNGAVDEKPKRARTRTRVAASEETTPTAATADSDEPKPTRTRSRAAKPADDSEKPKPTRTRSRATTPADDASSNGTVEEKPQRSRATAPANAPAADGEEKPKRTRASAAAAKAPAADGEAKPKRSRATAAKATAADGEAKPKRTRATAATAPEKPKRARPTKKDAGPDASIAAAAAATPRRRAKASAGDNGAPTPLERASEAVRDAVRDSKPAAPAGDEAA